MNDLIAQTDLTMIFGKRGTGKSTLSKQIQRAFPRRIVLDLMHEYQDDGAGVFVVDSITMLARVLIAITRRGERRFTVIFRRPLERDLGKEEREQLFELLFKFGDCAIVIEEIHDYMSREWMPHWLKNIVLLGRHRGLGVVATSQRPAEVSKTFVSQCHHVFVSRMTEANDVKYFLGSLQVEEKSLRNLEKFQFLRFLNGELKSKIRTEKQK